MPLAVRCKRPRFLNRGFTLAILTLLCPTLGAACWRQPPTGNFTSKISGCALASRMPAIMTGILRSPTLHQRLKDGCGMYPSHSGTLQWLYTNT